MKGWVILIGTLAVGFVLGVGAATRGSTLVAPYLYKAVSGPGEHLEGQVVRKQRDGNRLLVKVATAQGPMLVTFTQKVPDLDVLLDAGDVVTLLTPGYANFVDDPILEKVKGPRGAAPTTASPASPTTASPASDTPPGATR